MGIRGTISGGLLSGRISPAGLSGALGAGRGGCVLYRPGLWVLPPVFQFLGVVPPWPPSDWVSLYTMNRGPTDYRLRLSGWNLDGTILYFDDDAIVLPAGTAIEINPSGHPHAGNYYVRLEVLDMLGNPLADNVGHSEIFSAINIIGLLPTGSMSNVFMIKPVDQRHPGTAGTQRAAIVPYREDAPNVYRSFLSLLNTTRTTIGGGTPRSIDLTITFYDFGGAVTAGPHLLTLDEGAGLLESNVGMGMPTGFGVVVIEYNGSEGEIAGVQRIYAVVGGVSSTQGAANLSFYRVGT